MTNGDRRPEGRDPRDERAGSEATREPQGRRPEGGVSSRLRADGGERADPDSEVEQAIRANHPALITYITAGDPSLDETREYVEALDRGGADLIELGLPFSEPIAEGPTIQAAINRALSAGTTPEGFFDLVEGLETEAPLLVMTYYNMILQYGKSEARSASEESSGTRRERSEGLDEANGETVSGQGPRDQPDPVPFVERAAEAGLAGIIVPDLPAEESGPLREACEAHGLDLVFIVAPTTDDERLDSIMERTAGFAYVQARLGTTGARTDVSGATHDSLARLSEYDVPKAVGFGVSEGDHATEIVGAGADGVIVGSALVDLIAEADDPATALESKARELKEGAEQGIAEPEQP